MSSPPEKPGLVIRLASPTDVDFSARLHRRHLPHGLFPLLGHAFMRRWHATFLGAPEGIALIALRTGDGGEERVGFLVGAVDQVALVDHVLRHHRLELAASGAGALVLRPRLAVHFLRTRAPSYLRRMTGRTTPTSHRARQPGAAPDGTRQGRHLAPVAVLNALAIAPQARGEGAGAALVAAFVELARAAGSEQARLTTQAGADGAGDFYEGLGWQRHGVHTTRDGVLVATYHLVLVDDGATARSSPRATDQTSEDGAPLREQQTS